MDARSPYAPLEGRSSNSRGAREIPRRNVSQTIRMHVSDQDACLYALRVAYLSYLLQPRQKRVQHVANISKPMQRSSINDLVKDFSLIRDSKSTRFPHGFMAALDKRITGVLVGQEKKPEYNDPLIKRTFATFLNEFKNPTFRKSMEKDRRPEDLLLIFFSKATSELQKGKAPDDESWKLMVDRHVALFVRLISGTLQNNDWTRERPELSSRLKTLETKLLQHDQDLADTSQRAGGQGGTTVEVEIPRSYDVNDMPLVIRVCRIFAKPTGQAQKDINAHRDQWTERAAVKDLKDYQNHMMMNTRVTLCRDDFPSDEAFEVWRKNEFTELGQMMLALVQSDPSLAKSSSGGPLPHRPTFNPSDGGSGEYTHDEPGVDISNLNLGHTSPPVSRNQSMDGSQVDFTYIPPDARMYYRQALKAVLTHDLRDEDFQAECAAQDAASPRLLAKPSLDLLNELALRWRIAPFTRLALFLDVVREKLQHQEITLDTLDNALTFIREIPPEPKKTANKPLLPPPMQLYLDDRSRWSLADLTLLSNILSSLHDVLLRDLYETFQHCYENKPPSIGQIMFLLENHVYADPQFTQNDEDVKAFTQMMAEQLRNKAQQKYHEVLSSNISNDSSEWEFYHVIKFGQAVTALCQKIQKRYRNNPEVMNVNPLQILVTEVLPSFADDAKALITRIIEVTKQKGEEVPVQDGFELYKELVDIRAVYAQALPGRQFGFHIEGLLQDFVWRWIQMSDAKITDWIEGAVNGDDFQIRQDEEAKTRGDVPTDDERHSQSAIDMYRIFNQSIDQITKLSWDDDLQYAKFMTAISKSVGKGVARYCELLEARFRKEMDRQTPEQEMRAQQSSRDKWLTAAKDVWNSSISGQKIEPFQFWPESFVKINDIEYAILQLDKVEKEMNVDGCVAVIQKHEPPTPASRRRTDNKFMFTIKIIEAEDLKAGDMNGLSDPYVVLGDEYQKRLAKTRTVYQSLNPRWDETVDILTTGPLNVIATVWDWDVIGDHDCLGRTSLKLDPNHFNDFLPREYWLDLDTQGRVLVRVSMEGERDDIQFYFGKAFRTLKRAERDMTRQITDKLSAYVLQCLSRRTLKALTSSGTLGGVSINSMRGYFSKVSGQVAGRPGSGPSTTTASSAPVTAEAASNALKPLLQYFDDNFAIMKQTLTDSAMILVMTRLWKEALVTIEGLLVPPLSDKASSQKPLSQHEVDIVYRWLQILFDFFHAFDADRGIADGIPLDVLKSPKYHDLQNLNFFYFETTDNLIRTSESMAAATVARHQSPQTHPSSPNRFSAPPGSLSYPSTPTLSTRRSKSILQSRNLGTMRQAKEQKRREIQADPNDDMLLRILRMRPDAERYLKDRSRQKERLAAAAAAEAIVRQSLSAQGHGAGRHGYSQSIGANVGGRGGVAERRGRGASHSAAGAAGAGGAGARRWDTIRE